MSLTTFSPLVMDWIKNGLKWKYVWQPVYRPLTIPANGQVQLPQGDFIYKASEGVAITFGAMFDHPDCGIRFNTPQLDTGDIFTVNNISALGTYNQPWFVEANVPPQTIDGTYTILQYKEWAWTDWAELYLINTDSVDHICYTFAYTLALLLESRPPDKTETALLAMLANSLYPIEAELKKKIPKSTVDRWIADVKSRKIFEPKYEREGK